MAGDEKTEPDDVEHDPDAAEEGERRMRGGKTDSTATQHAEDDPEHDDAAEEDAERKMRGGD